MEESPRRQQRKSCDVCRRRKVRCNLVLKQDGPCAVCEKGGFRCTTTANWPAPRRSTFSRRSIDVPSPSQAHTNIQQPLREAALLTGRPSHHASVNAEQSTAASADDSDHFVRTNLSHFFDDGNSPDWWRVYQVPDDFRVAYIGTPASNLAHLVDLRRLHGSLYHTSTGGPPLPPLSSPDSTTTINTTLLNQPIVPQPSHGSATKSVAGRVLQRGRKPLHYPYPRIRPPRPWHPQAQICLQSSQDLATDLSSFPAQEIRQALVLAYFEHIHPWFPVVTESWLLEPDGKPRSNAPLILFQAVLLAGAHACSHPLVAKDRQMVKSVLFRRASMLYHLRHETDRLHLMQTALLFTWHINDGDTVAGGPWYWSGEAVRIGFGLGMHRYSQEVPLHDRIYYKRTWWCSFISEVFASLEMGRPCAVRKEDVDQNMLSREDLDEIHKRLVSTDSRWRHNFVNFSLTYFNRMITLAYIALDVMALNAPGGQQIPDATSIDSRLAAWAIASGNTASDLKDEDFFTKQLCIHYNLVVLHLHRNFSNESSTSHQNCSTATQAIIRSLEELASRGWLIRSHFTTVGAVTAAGIQLVQDIRFSILDNASLVALNHIERLGRLLKCAKILAQTWPSAEAVYDVFEGLRQEYQRHVSQGLEGQVEPPEYQLDWNSLFASMQAADYGDIGTEQEWLSLANWTDLG